MEELILPPAMIETATTAADWVLVLPIVLCLAGAALTLMLRKVGRLRFLFTLLVVVAVIACEIVLLQRVFENGPLAMTMGKWLPPFGISLVADTLGAGFALVAAVVTMIVLIYAEGERRAGVDDQFHAMVLLLLAGVTGSFLTGDLFNLYVWFEVMLIASFGLMVSGGKPLELDAAVKYGFLNFLATAFFLLALGLLYGLLGTLNMADIMRVAPGANSAAMTGIAAILLVAFGMKAAVFPLNAWLPASYHAPAAAVSALFAGLLTKVGAYALLRSLLMLLPGSRDVLEPVLVALAVATLLVAPLGAIAETNLRRAIGFLVIGGIGAILAGLALPGGAGLQGAGFYVFHAMLAMTALYLVAGLIERATGAVDTREMGGLYAASAPLSVMFFVLVLAVAGLPPFLGFWPKLMLLQGAMGQGGWTGGLLAAALLGNALLTLIGGTRIWAHVFWRTGVKPISKPHRNTVWTAIAPAAILVAVIAAAGLWPNSVVEVLAVGTADWIDPARYVAATGLAGAVP